MLLVEIKNLVEISQTLHETLQLSQIDLDKEERKWKTLLFQNLTTKIQ